jgi:hypothetical protein
MKMHAFSPPAGIMPPTPVGQFGQVAIQAFRPASFKQQALT